MARSRQRPPFRAPRPKNRSWSGITSAAFTAVAASAKVLLGSFVLAVPTIDETILRTVGLISIETDNQATAENQIGGFGLIRVSTTAFAIGITAIPGPITDIDDDGWLVYVPFAASTGTVAASLNSVQYHFDSKAKRKIQDGESVAIVVENASSVHGFDIAVHLRLLAMLTG